MSKIPALGLLASAVLLAGCRSERPSEEEYLEIAAQTVRVAEQDARAAAVAGSGTGPLLLDVASFAGGAQRAIGQVLPRERVAAALDSLLEQPFRPTLPDSSFNCLEMELGNSCWVPFDGVFVHLNLANRAPGRLTLDVTSTVTAGNYIPPVLCDRVLRIQFEKREDEWVLDEKTPLRSC